MSLEGDVGNDTFTQTVTITDEKGNEITLDVAGQRSEVTSNGVVVHEFADRSGRIVLAVPFPYLAKLEFPS